MTRSNLKNVFGSASLSMIFMLSFIIASLGWAGDSLGEFIAGIVKGEFNWGLLIPTVFFGVLIFILHKKAKAEDDLVEIKHIKLKRDSAETLIFTLSPPNFEINDVLENIDTLYPFSLDSENHYNAQMPLIAIDHHRQSLKKIVVLLTKGESGSEGSKDVFERLLNHVFGNEFKDKVEFRVIENSPESMYKEVLKQYETQSESQIIVDITSGTKESSIALTSATFGEKRKIQYVKCSNGQYEVVGYDMKETT